MHIADQELLVLLVVLITLGEVDVLNVVESLLVELANLDAVVERAVERVDDNVVVLVVEALFVELAAVDFLTLG